MIQVNPIVLAEVRENISSPVIIVHNYMLKVSMYYTAHKYKEIDSAIPTM